MSRRGGVPIVICNRCLLYHSPYFTSHQKQLCQYQLRPHEFIRSVNLYPSTRCLFLNHLVYPALRVCERLSLPPFSFLNSTFSSQSRKPRKTTNSSL